MANVNNVGKPFHFSSHQLQDQERFSSPGVLISVGIQKMVSAKTSGVMFTLDPTNGDPSKVVIEGSWGFGETVVGGYVNPDKFVVDKITKEINERKSLRNILNVCMIQRRMKWYIWMLMKKCS
jgi:pyruvate,water dikinase